MLAGDYLLARASVLLARLENTAVVQIMATALESLVSGEIMQLKSPPESLLQMETYLRKSYYKTASLICYACRSCALLGGHAYGSTVATSCEEFGFHLGLAYQIQDDILDFTAAANVLGKPALADMDLGLSTAPMLYAAEEYPILRPLVMRRFKNKGDKQMALEHLYMSTTAMDKAKALAAFHAQVSFYHFWDSYFFFSKLKKRMGGKDIYIFGRRWWNIDERRMRRIIFSLFPFPPHLSLTHKPPLQPARPSYPYIYV